ncbi:MAG: HNH endonuclease family protein [Acidimicrobiia bacterium]
MPYDRDRFGGWIDADHDCQDTRSEVLAAESRAPIVFASLGECRVLTGSWRDAYTGEVVTEAARLDVDHFVPLEAAWIAGAWRWTDEQRGSFANDLLNPEALVAVTASANRSKGSRGPAEWKPNLRSSWCDYAVSWIAVKTRWALTVETNERSALRTMLQGC